MSAEANDSYTLGTLQVVQPEDIRAFTTLLEALDGDSRYTPGIPVNLGRAAMSETATVFTVRRDADHRTVSTATLSCLPVLTESGIVAWIDDVVTDPEEQGRGLSKLTMNAMEAQASRVSDAVSLTSGVELSSGASRGSAKAAYAKRGYQLHPQGLAAYRTTRLGTVRPENVELVTDYREADIEVLALLLDQQPETLELNLQSVLSATHTSLLIRRHGRDITAAAVANLTPIPTGFKPWIDDLTGAEHADRLAVLGAAEQWIGQHGGLYANIVASSDQGLSGEYQQRSSGLFIKPLGGPEAPIA